MKRITFAAAFTLLLAVFQIKAEYIDIKPADHFTDHQLIEELTADPVTFTFGQGTGSAAPHFEKSYNYRSNLIVMSRGNTFTVSVPDSLTLTMVEISFPEPTALSVEGGSFHDGQSGWPCSYKPEDGNNQLTFHVEAEEVTLYSFKINFLYPTGPVSCTTADENGVIECRNNESLYFSTTGADAIRMIMPGNKFVDAKCTESTKGDRASVQIVFPQNTPSMPITVYPVKNGFHHTEYSRTFTVNQLYNDPSSSDTCIDGLYYSLTTVSVDGVQTTVAQVNYNDRYRDMSSITIPDNVTINGVSYPVGVLNSRAFNACVYLKEITLPSNLYYIWYGAFNGCRSLQSIKFPDTLIEIRYNSSSDVPVLNNCSALTSVTLPNNSNTWCTQSFCASFFKGCTSLKEIVIPDNVTSLCSDFFKDAESLETIVFGKSLSYFPSSIITLPNLKELKIAEGNTNFKFEGDGLYKSTPDHTYQTLVYLLKEPADGVLRLPDTCTGIQSGAVSGMTFKEIVYPSTLTSTGYADQLSGCKVGKLVIPGAMESIGSRAFRYSEIDTLVIEHSDTPLALTPYDSRYQNDGAFYSSEFKKVIINRDLDTVDGYLWPKSYTKPFYRCSVSEIEINTSLGADACGAFYSVSPSRIVIGPDVETLYALGTYTANVMEFHPLAKVTGALNVNNGEYNTSHGYTFNGYDATTIYAHLDQLDVYKEVYPYRTVLPFEEECNIWLGAISRTMRPGSEYAVEYKTIPGDMPVKWNTSDASVATVSEEGVITAVGTGIAYITATGDATGYTGISSRMTVTVSEEAVETADEASLTITGVGPHATRHTYRHGQSARIEIIPDSNWNIDAITFNGEDASSMLENNILNTPALEGENSVNVVMSSDDLTGTEANMTSQRDVYVRCGGTDVEVFGLEESDQIAIYDVEAHEIYSGTSRRVSLAPGEVYIIRTPYKSFKVML